MQHPTPFYYLDWRGWRETWPIRDEYLYLYKRPGAAARLSDAACCRQRWRSDDDDDGADAIMRFYNSCSDLWRGNRNKSKSDGQTRLRSLQISAGMLFILQKPVFSQREEKIKPNTGRCKFTIGCSFQPGLFFFSCYSIKNKKKCARGHTYNQILMHAVISAWKPKHFQLFCCVGPNII